MFNFTYQSKKSNGRFNGRYAFRAPIEGAKLRPSDLSAIANGDEKALGDDVLMHEYLHWKVFRHSKVGISLVGKRSLVRVKFLMGNHKAVENYYIQRACYFIEAYSPHEDAVEEIEKKIGRNPSVSCLLKLKIDKKHIKAIKKADRSAVEKCREYRVPYRATTRVLDSIFGIAATKEFGIQAYIDAGQGKRQLHEVSLKGSTFGFINAPTDTIYSQHPPAYIKALRAIVRFINTERWFGGLTPEIIAHWVFIRYKTMIPLMNDQKFMSSMPQEWKDARAHVIDDVNFVCAYAGIDYDRQYRGLIVNLLIECGDPKAGKKQILDRLLKLDGEFLYYFYAHGN
jgi:hypothetical protein